MEEMPSHDTCALNAVPADWKMHLDAAIKVDLPRPGALSGQILHHCVGAVHGVRQKTGGQRLCVYKLGITSDLSNRWPSYQKAGFTTMVCIHTSMSLASIEMLEAALIHSFKHELEGALRNVNKGGEGMRKKCGKPRFSPPYFMYVVAARADQKRRISA